MDKKVIINQFFGLGDIMFIEPIYRHYHNQGYQVIAPVEDHYYWVSEYIQYVHFRKKSEFPYDYESLFHGEKDGALHVPLRFAHPLYRGLHPHCGDYRENWMRDKYLYLGLDEQLWRTLQWTRNTAKEDALVARLGISGPYNLVNPNYGGGFSGINITPKNDLPNIAMSKIDNFSLLDWAPVIERASNIYTVETSLLWLVEALNTQAQEYHLYPRVPHLDNVNYIKDYLKKNWTFYEAKDL